MPARCSSPRWTRWAAGDPVCMLGLQLHILTAGATFNLHTRQASPGAARAEGLTHHATPPGGGLDADPRIATSTWGLRSTRTSRSSGCCWTSARWSNGPPRSWARPSSTACWRRCPDWPSTAAPIASPAASSAACARARAPGWAMCWNTSPSNCRTSPARTSPSARPAASDGRPACIRWSTNTRRSEEGIAAGELALKLLDSLLPAGLRSADRRRLALGRSARRLHPLRAAPRAGSVDDVAGARRRGTRHPVAAPQRAVAGAARPRQVPAAHPGHGHRAHPHIAVELASDKEETNKILGSLGLPVPRQELVQQRRARDARRAQAGRPGGAQALQRQPRPRHHHQRQRETKSAPASRPRASIRAR
jgi:hypothetical protein